MRLDPSLSCSVLISDPNRCDRVVDVLVCSLILVHLYHVISAYYCLSRLFRPIWGPNLPCNFQLMTRVLLRTMGRHSWYQSRIQHSALKGH